MTLGAYPNTMETIPTIYNSTLQSPDTYNKKSQIKNLALSYSLQFKALDHMWRDNLRIRLDYKKQCLSPP